MLLGEGPGLATVAAALLRAGAGALLDDPDPGARERLDAVLGREGLALGGDAPALAVSFAPVDAPALPWLAATHPVPPGAAGLPLAAPPGRLLEVTPGPPEAVEAARALARALGVPLLLAPAPGLCAPLLGALHDAADALLLEGAEVAEVDAAAEAAGLPPLYAERDARGPAPVDPARAPSVMAARMIVEGKLGRALGAGWYRYPGGLRVEDPIVDDLSIEEARFAGVERRAVPDAEIAERLRAAVAAEAARLRGRGAGEADLSLAAERGLRLPPGLV